MIFQLKSFQTPLMKMLSVDFLAIFVILAAPYLNYAVYQGFLLELANIFIFFAIILISIVLTTLLWVAPSSFLRVAILTGVLLLFIDIEFDWIHEWGGKVWATALAVFLFTWILRRHVSQILLAIFGTILLGTLAISLANHLTNNNGKELVNGEDQKTDLPIYVHIILDEQMGIAGFDEELINQNSIKNEMMTFFGENNFRVFGNAYSPYYDSINSISATLNLKTTQNPDKLYAPRDDFQYELLRSQYFSEIKSQGYKINIYQSNYMDFCRSIKDIQRCLTYRPDGATSSALSSLMSNEKTIIIIGLYSTQSFFYEKLQEFYHRLRRYLSRHFVALDEILPAWENWSERLGPISVLPIFDTLIKDISKAKRGTMFFAHLLIPHYPYSVDSACQIRRPLLKWKDHIDYDNPEQANSPRSRLEKYEEYIPQIRCTFMKVNSIFEVLKSRGLFEDAIIIIHGDHGSRIVLTQPMIEYKKRLTSQDYFDAFSALLAIKSSEVSSGYDGRMEALPELLGDFVSGGFSEPRLAEDKEMPFVFLRSNKDEISLTKVPMPRKP